MSFTKTSWRYLAPIVSNLEHYGRTLPSNHRGIVPKTLPDKCLPRSLLTARLQGKICSIVHKGDPVPAAAESYSVQQECNFFLAATAVHPTYPCLQSEKSILLKSGSKVFVHRYEDGKVLAMVVALGGREPESSEVLSAIGSSKYDAHSVSTNCQVKLE